MSKPATDTEPKPDTDKNRVKSFTCAECGETRNLMDFYDESPQVHHVYLTREMTTYIDHGAGKAALEAYP